MKKLMKIVFFLVMRCAAIALAVPTQHAEERQVPKARPQDAEEVCVLGNVRNPSAVPVEATITLAEAISRAGGALPDLKANRANIVRRLANGEVQIMPVKNLEKKGPSLKANDIIDVFSKERKQRVNASMSAPCGAWYMLFKRTM